MKAEEVENHFWGKNSGRIIWLQVFSPTHVDLQSEETTDLKSGIPPKEEYSYTVDSSDIRVGSRTFWNKISKIFKIFSSLK